MLTLTSAKNALREVHSQRNGTQKRELFLLLLLLQNFLFFFASNESVFVLFLSESNAFCSLLVFVIRERRRQRERHTEREKTKRQKNNDGTVRAMRIRDALTRRVSDDRVLELQQVALHGKGVQRRREDDENVLERRQFFVQIQHRTSEPGRDEDWERTTRRRRGKRESDGGRAVSEVSESSVEVLYHAAEKRGRRADGFLRVREVQTHVFSE